MAIIKTTKLVITGILCYIHYPISHFTRAATRVLYKSPSKLIKHLLCINAIFTIHDFIRNPNECISDVW